MSSENSTSTWSDRRGLFQRGKEVHEPGRKMSGTGIAEAVRRASVGSTGESSLTQSVSGANDAGPSSPTSSRRRSSGVPFENLTNLKRGSQEYGERRASHGEMLGQGGFVSGWFNKTFRGIQSGVVPTSGVQKQDAKGDSRRGVMEWIEQRTDSA